MALPITLYGAQGCHDTDRSRDYLTEQGIPFTEVDVDESEEAARFVTFINRGNRSTPTLVFGDGSYKLLLTEPTNEELGAVLGQAGYRRTE